MKTLVFVIRPYKLGELAFFYQVSKPTFKKWLRPFQAELGTAVGHFFNHLQVQLIVQKLGWPSLLVS